MDDRRYYTQEDCDTVINGIRDGYAYVKKLQDRTGETDAFFVYLFSDDALINYYTVFYLPILRKEKNISAFVVVTPREETAEMVRRDSRVPYRLEICTSEDMRCISTYYRAFPSGPNTRNKVYGTIVNGCGDNGKERLMSLLGFKGINQKAIVALSVFQWYRIPDDKEVRAAEDYVYKKTSTGTIDWGKYSCREIPGPINFPDNVDIGLKPLLDGGIRKDDKIAVFSYTKTSRYIVDALSEYNVVAMLDNNGELAGTEYNGVRVYTPEEYLSGENKRDIKIIVATRSYRAICEQLYDLGYRIGEQVFLAYINVNYLHPGIFEDKFNNGRAVYDDIRSRYPDRRLFFITFPGTGDIYLAGMYLREQMIHDGVDDGVLILIGNNCKRVYDVLDCDAPVVGVEVIRDHPTALDFGLFVRQLGYEKLNVCKLGHGNELLDTGYIRGNSGLDLNEVYQLTAHSDKKMTGIGVRTEDAAYLFEENDIRQGRTAVLSPYAKCMTPIPDSFWRALTERLTELGYDVCTNVAGEEKSIEGTKGIMIPYINVMDFINKAGVFIGLRSGLCDIISGVSAKKIILYGEDNRSGEDYHYNFCSLEKMGIAGDNIYEIILDADYKQSIETITNVLI